MTQDSSLGTLIKEWPLFHSQWLHHHDLITSQILCLLISFLWELWPFNIQTLVIGGPARWISWAKSWSCKCEDLGLNSWYLGAETRVCNREGSKWRVCRDLCASCFSEKHYKVWEPENLFLGLVRRPGFGGGCMSVMGVLVSVYPREAGSNKTCQNKKEFGLFWLKNCSVDRGDV